MPHKSRPPDAISKPSHPQYFHIKEHSQHKQVAGAAVLLDWACGLDGVFFLTRREHHCASAGTALGLHLLTVRVVVFMKSCLPASKVGSQRSASALTADGGALPDQVRVVCS